jgi:hypothetical protein
MRDIASAYRRDFVLVAQEIVDPLGESRVCLGLLAVRTLRYHRRYGMENLQVSRP